MEAQTQISENTTDPLHRKGYHHGNLNEALLLSARNILETDGLATLSLRAVARKAGVSHNAPYHHFSNKAELIAQVAKRGFEDLTATMAEEAEKFPSDAHHHRLVAVGQAYIQFALAHPALFTIMFHPEWTKPAKFPSLKTSMQGAFNILLKEVEAAIQANALTTNDPNQAALGAWSLVHGFSTLYNEKVMMETQLGEFEQTRLINSALACASQALGFPG